jgi:hypothetical protein
MGVNGRHHVGRLPIRVGTRLHNVLRFLHPLYGPYLSTHNVPHCPMSSTHNTTSTASNFQAIFDVALKDYTEKTGKDLRDLHDPLASKLDSCDSPDSILDIFREQAREFDEFKKGDTKLFKWLNPIVKVLHAVSTNKGILDSASRVNPAISLFIIIIATDTISRCFHPRRQCSPLSNSFYPCVSPSLSPPNSPSHPELLGGQGREQKLRFPSRYFRVHRKLPYTARHLYRNSAQ